MTREEMRERVAQLFCGGSNPCEACIKDADAAIAIIRGETLEEAARVAEDMPINGHGDLAVEPYAAAKQVSDEIAAAIRALKDKP